MVKPNIPISIGNRRPRSSDRGAQQMGPVANPTTYKDNPSRDTSGETPKMAATFVVAVENMLLVNVEVSVV